MRETSFFKKVISYLSELNRGNQTRLIEDGWLSVEEVERIKIILWKLGLIEKKDDDIHLTRKGLNVLLYSKINEKGLEYNKQVLKLLKND